MSDSRAVVDGYEPMKTSPRVAVITGASSGIGAALARRLARGGTHVGLSARRTDLLDALAAEIRAGGGTAEAVAADAEDIPGTIAAVHALAARLGPVDLMIANAGLGRKNPASAFDAAELATTLRVNLVGAAAAIQAVLPSMLARRRGQVVGISSLAAYRGLPGSSAYCASKAGLTALLESLRAELRPAGIVVTAVHPGFVRTAMIEGPGRHPFAMDVDRAAAIIERAIRSGRPHVAFPRPTAALATLGRWLPAGVSDRLTRILLGEG